MRLRLSPALPLVLGVAVWVFGAGLLIANLLMPLVGRGPIKMARPLIGVVQPDTVDASWPAVLNGSFQAAYARLVGTHLPLYADAVRLRNQLEFTLAGVSATPSVVVGTGGRIFEGVYSEEYCSRDLAAWRPKAQFWASQIRRMQDAVQAKGKTFLYMLTPSKVAQYPDILPAGYHCPASQADRDGTVPAWLDALRGAGVTVLDTTAVLSAAHGRYPFPMYPSGGAHWNDVGAALAEQALLQRLHTLDPAGGFEPFAFTFRMTPNAEGVDIDLANLMNLRKRFPGKPVPVVDVQPAPPPSPCPGRRVVIVGGSFSHMAVEYLARATCNPSPVEYEYWRAYRITWNGRAFDVQPGVDPARRAADLETADVVIYEENEQVLPDPAHGRAFLAYLTAPKS